MDQFRLQISALYSESLSAVPDFMSVRGPHVRAAMNRRPWESECFFGEHNLTSFVKRIFGINNAAPNYVIYIACVLQMLAMSARRPDLNSNYMFVPLLSSPWLVAAIIGILIYHWRYDADFSYTWRPATNYDWYNLMEYGPQLEIQHPIRERTPLEDDNFDPFIEGTRAQHTLYLYAFVLIWILTNFGLLLSMVPKTHMLLAILFACVWICVVLFIFRQFYDIYNDLEFVENLEYFD